MNTNTLFIISAIRVHEKKHSEPRRYCFVWLAMTIFFFLFSPFLLSQTKTFSSISKYERRWVFFHPFAAIKIKRHQKEMYAVYKEVKDKNLLDVFENGGKSDAFRHTFAMAYFSKYVATRKLRKLGIAHEKGNYQQFQKNKIDEGGELPDSLSSVMDLQNNELGFSIAKEVKKLSAEEIKQKVIQLILNGNAVIIKRNTEGLYVDCDGSIISRQRIYTRWNIPKCLVKSNS